METLQKTALFWDVDLKELNAQKNEKFVVERILAFGDTDDVRWASEQYGKEKLKQYALESNKLNPKSQFFWCQYFNLSQIECTKKQSQKKLSPFWTN
ncbi:MAG: hypothetical protein WC848_00775 [Parcubacteria group bacterium]|jgi:hypothetical protein